MKSDGLPQIRKLGKDYYIKAEDCVAMFEHFAEDGLAQLMDIDDDDQTDFDYGFFEGGSEVLEDLAATIKLMVTTKRLNKVNTIEEFDKEFPVSKSFKRNRKLQDKQIE